MEGPRKRRLIFVPQYPAKLRYQEWWRTEFPKQFEALGWEVETLSGGELRDVFYEDDDFAPVDSSIAWEINQIYRYMRLTLRENDVLLLADLSFPGLFAQTLMHKRPNKCYAICHATSKNRYDYFAKDRKIKYPIEKSTAKLFDKVFVGSRYHKEKLGWDNLEVTYLPYPSFSVSQGMNYPKKYKVSSVAREGLQKVNKRLERQICKDLGITIHRPPENIRQIDKFNALQRYHQFLQDTSVLLITSKEETFGYQVMDGIMNGCVVLAPNKLSYPELLPRIYLYDDIHELKAKLQLFMDFHKSTFIDPLLVHSRCSLFYKTLSNIMKHE